MLASVLAVCAAGCGSSGPKATPTSASGPPPLGPLKACLRKHGYAVAPESARDVGTAPRRFGFVAVWNLRHPPQTALALTFSRDAGGAKQAATWTRRTNTRIGRGALIAPVVRVGVIDVLWTAKPRVGDAKDVYGCLRRQA